MNRPPDTKRATRAKPAADEEEDSTRELHERQAENVVGGLLGRMHAFERLFPNAAPKALANHVQLYQQGLVDGLAFATPEFHSRISETIEAAMCDGGTNAGALVALTRIVRQMPELASPSAFDCVFEKHRDDAVLSSALDAFGAAQLPPSAALAALGDSVTNDELRTRLHALGQGTY